MAHVYGTYECQKKKLSKKLIIVRLIGTETF